MKVCTVGGCEKFVKGSGYCDKHYQQLKRHGESGVDKSVISTHTCKNQVCGKAFRPKHRRQYYCCVECKVADYKATGRIKEVMNRFNKSEKGKARTRRYLDTGKGKIYNRNKSARHMKRTKNEIRRALFGRARELGIDGETLRDDIAPAVIGKRISEANNHELGKVIDYITNRAGGKSTPPFGHPSRGEYKKYPSSRKGLLEEVRDLAIERYGQEEYAERLNNLCARFGEKDGYHKMRVAALKRLKERIIELNKTSPWEKE